MKSAWRLESSDLGPLEEPFTGPHSYLLTVGRTTRPVTSARSDQRVEQPYGELLIVQAAVLCAKRPKRYCRGYHAGTFVCVCGRPAGKRYESRIDCVCPTAFCSCALGSLVASCGTGVH